MLYNILSVKHFSAAKSPQFLQEHSLTASLSRQSNLSSSISLTASDWNQAYFIRPLRLRWLEIVSDCVLLTCWHEAGSRNDSQHHLSFDVIIFDLNLSEELNPFSVSSTEAAPGLTAHTVQLLLYNSRSVSGVGLVLYCRQCIVLYCTGVCAKVISWPWKQMFEKDHHDSRWSHARNEPSYTAKHFVRGEEKNTDIYFSSDL